MYCEIKRLGVYLINHSSNPYRTARLVAVRILTTLIWGFLDEILPRFLGTLSLESAD